MGVMYNYLSLTVSMVFQLYLNAKNQPFAVTHGCILKHLEGFALKTAGLFLLIENTQGMQRAHKV